jgi:hypothetical protein
MVSLIICSINQERCEKLLKNISDTIGVEFETIVFDNKIEKWGICKVYNYCAKKAKYPYLCFVHEDILMGTKDWGRIIINFMNNTTDCGVIGFAGGTVVEKNFLGWGYGTGNRYCNYYDPGFKQKNQEYNVKALDKHYSNPNNEEFAKALTLDGLFLFVKKEVWIKSPFDEDMFQGFHFYDADFTFGIAQKKQNYVCFQADIYHFSGGNVDRVYCENARNFQHKWKNKLPHCIEKQRITIVDELNTAFELFNYSKCFGYTFWKCISHLIKINGYIFFLVFLYYNSCKFGKKIIKGFYRSIVPQKFRNKKSNVKT